MTVYPASTRRADIGAPILPRPTKPTFAEGLLISVVLFQDGIGNPEGLERCRHPGIYRCLKQRLLDLRGRSSVGERAADVDAEFVRPVEGRQHSQVEQTAGLPVKSLARPHDPPAVLGDELLHRSR